MSGHDHQFAEEETPDGARILFPCLICGMAAADALLQAQGERDHALEALRADALAPPEPRWQPIATAPRDSRRVLVYCPSADPDARTVFEAWWRMPYEAAPLDRCWWCYDGNKTMLSADVHTAPDGTPLGATMWMPLPAPPRADAREAPRTESPAAQDLSGILQSVLQMIGLPGFDAAWFDEHGDWDFGKLRAHGLDAKLAEIRAALRAAALLAPWTDTETNLATFLELDGPQPASVRVAAFLRHYAMIIRRNERWDTPETMARAYESAAAALDAAPTWYAELLAIMQRDQSDAECVTAIEDWMETKRPQDGGAVSRPR